MNGASPRGPAAEPGAWPKLQAPSRLALLRAIDAADSEFGEAIALLGACGVADCLSYPVGLIDRLLLQAHRAVLHRDPELVVACPACRALNALPFGPGDVPEYGAYWAWCGPGAGVREPTGADIAALPGDAAEAARELERRCQAGPADGPRDAAALDRVDQSLSGTVRAACTECGGPVSAVVDVQHLVTAAIAADVAQVDLEIHRIAARYGWDLATIESLHDSRRVRLAALAGGEA